MSNKTQYEDPMDFLMAVMNGDVYSTADKIDAAAALMPYFHEEINPIEEYEEEE